MNEDGMRQKNWGRKMGFCSWICGLNWRLNRALREEGDVNAEND